MTGVRAAVLPVPLLLAACVTPATPVSPAPALPDGHPRAYVCRKTDGSIRVDGRGGDEAWDRAPWSEEFVDILGDAGPRPTLPTRFRMLWDERSLYLLAEMEEPHIWATETRHDAVIFHENDFEVFLDPDGDHHDYVELEVNALGTTWDLLLPKPYRVDGHARNGFELAGLELAVHLDGTLNDPTDVDRGWTVEMSIPWKAIGGLTQQVLPPAVGDRMRINFSRVQWHTDATSGSYEKAPGLQEQNWVWSPQGLVDMHRPERWGYVLFADPDGGGAPFTGDPSRAVRERLVAVLDAQLGPYDAGRGWTGTLAELDLPPGIPVELRMTEGGWEATAPGPAPGGGTGTWRIRHDGLLTAPR